MLETQEWADTLDFFLDTDQTEELQLYLIHTWFRHSCSASCINITIEGAEVFFSPIPAALLSLCCPSVSHKSPVPKWNSFFYNRSLKAVTVPPGAVLTSGSFSSQSCLSFIICLQQHLISVSQTVDELAVLIRCPASVHELHVFLVTHQNDRG